MAGFLVLGKPIVVLFFERGAFGPESSVMTAKALSCYTFGLWAFSGMRVLIAAFYALQDTKTPVKIAVVSLVINTLLSLFLMGPLKHAGLALSLSIASGVQFLLLALLLQKKRSVIHMGPVLKSFFRSIVATVVMGFIVFICRHSIFYTSASDPLSEQIVSLSLLVIIGIAVYFFMARLLGCPEMRAVLEMFRLKSIR